MRFNRCPSHTFSKGGGCFLPQQTHWDEAQPPSQKEDKARVPGYCVTVETVEGRFSQVSDQVIDEGHTGEEGTWNKKTIINIINNYQLKTFTDIYTADDSQSQF